MSIAYFFTDKVDAQVQAQLINFAINLCFEYGIKIWNITCDGTSTNIRTLEIFGCKINVDNSANMRTYFFHPNRKCKILAILDPPHMIKLARNTIADYKEIISDKGLIQWEYVKKLYELQTEITVKFKNVGCRFVCWVLLMKMWSEETRRSRKDFIRQLTRRFSNDEKEREWRFGGWASA